MATRLFFSSLPLCALACGLAGSFAGPGGVRAETLTLADCLRETAAHNPEIINEQYAVQEATATRLTLRARALPTLGISTVLGYLGERNTQTRRIASKDPVTGKTTFTDQDTERAGTALVIGAGQLTQPIFDAAIPASWRRGDIGTIVAQENYYTAVATQLNLARTLYYQALFQQENGGVLRRLDEGLAGEVKTLDQLVTGGVVGRQALLAAQVQRANFGPSIIATAGTFDNALTTLLLVMGREQGPAGSPGSSSTRNIRLAGPLEDRAIAFDAAAAAREALAHRPDIRGLRAAIRSITEDANIARGGYYPLIRVYVAGELIPQDFVQRTETNSTRQADQTQQSEIRPGVRADWIVIDTGAVRGTVRGLEAQRDVISIALQTAERNLPSDLALVRSRMLDASNKIAALRGNTDTAENTLTMIQGGVAQGLNSQLEFFDAENGVLAARSGLLAAQLEMSLAHAEFDRLTGRYLKFTPEATEADAKATHPAPARH